MKILTLIFSIYVLLMAVIPCCTFDRCSAEEVVSISKGKAPAAEHSERQGPCSPFFSCHTCAVPVLLVRALHIEPVSQHYEPRYCELTTAHLPGYTAKCWNPPKLA